MIDIIIATVSLIVDDYKPREEIYTEQSTDVNVSLLLDHCIRYTSSTYLGVWYNHQHTLSQLQF